MGSRGISCFDSWGGRFRRVLSGMVVTALVVVLSAPMGAAATTLEASGSSSSFDSPNEVQSSPLFAQSLVDTIEQLEQIDTAVSPATSLRRDEAAQAKSAVTPSPELVEPEVITPTTDYTCYATCGTTCMYTCLYTCGTQYTCYTTCDDPTCAGQPTCSTTCVYTCIYTCGMTCDDATCSSTCGTTCDDATCSSTCGSTCETTCDGATCDGATCGSTCTYTCEADCGSDDDNIPGVPIPDSPVMDTVDDTTDEDDVFRFYLGDGDTIDASITGPAGTDFDLYLFPPGSTDVGSDPAVAVAQDTTYPDALSYTVPGGQSGTYYLDVWAWSGSGAYTLTWSITYASGGTTEVIAIAGPDRYSTAVEVSKQAFPGGAPCVVIATGQNWPDALGGASLAAAKQGPILLTAPDALPWMVDAEIDRLGASEAVILGGTAAVSGAVESALVSKLGAGAVSRIGGSSRYETAELIAKATVDEWGVLYDGTAFFATGRNFPDALAASPLAAAHGWPLFLATGDSLFASTIAALDYCGVNRALLLGGTSVVSPVIEGYLQGRVGTDYVTRLAGGTRYATACVIASYGCNEAGLVWNGVAVATGENFPDALAGGVLQGRDGSVMVLTPGTYLHPDTAASLGEHAIEIGEVKYLGGTGAVSQAVRDAIASILD